MALKKIDKITRWRKAEQNRFGENAFGDPEELDVRWNDQGRLSTTEEGTEFMPLATIYFDTADLISIGDRVANHPIAGVDGDSLNRSFVVRACKTSRNGSGTKFLYTALVSSTKR